MKQPGLFDERAAERTRDKALRRVRRPISEERMALLIGLVFEIASHHEELTTDDLERVLDARNIPRPAEPRALGAVMVACRKLGYVQATDRTRQSKMRTNHRRPKRVWRSLLYRRAA